MTTGRTLISGEFKGDNADKVSCIRTKHLMTTEVLKPATFEIITSYDHLNICSFNLFFFLQSPCGRRQKETGDGGHRTDQ